ncbi:EF-hand domain-containing protein [Glacieibacterium frigidum]|uniref:EF-hand domain-containing protein n=1 Tax=Glacieibacterium frigidum TaxID=2593303 RepID=A0A552UJC1_9SPHN|nr:hypothetical protein [Glacieibacterium frigidum]TRW18280.1 hypothetical protein FMM06_09365 [Glacieibacterium frigidum]
MSIRAALAVPLLLLPFAVLAQPAPPPPGAPMPPPAAARLGPLFIAPSGEPFRGVAGEPYPVAAWFARADADHDGKLTRGEFRKDAMSYFPTLDQNGDGIVDAREITRYEEELVPEVRVGFGGSGGFRGGFASGPGPDGGDGSTPAARKLPELPRGAGRYGLINSPQPVISVDTDLNRRVTPQEMSAAADRRFTLLDPDARGYLTLATLPKTPIQQRGEAAFKRK